MEIVFYEAKDSHEVATFFREIFKESGWKEEPSDNMDNPHLLFHLPDRGFLLLAKEGSHVIGTAGVVFLNKNEGLIKRFYLSKTYRGTGIATELLHDVQVNAKARGIKKLVLDVSKTNTRAIHFYEKSGFLPMEVTPMEGWIESNQPETHLYFSRSVDQ